jgi:hypothetical protein
MSIQNKLSTSLANLPTEPPDLTIPSYDANQTWNMFSGAAIIDHHNSALSTIYAPHASIPSLPLINPYADFMHQQSYEEPGQIIGKKRPAPLAQPSAIITTSSAPPSALSTSIPISRDLSVDQVRFILPEVMKQLGMKQTQLRKIFGVSDSALCTFLKQTCSERMNLKIQQAAVEWLNTPDVLQGKVFVEPVAVTNNPKAAHNAPNHTGNPYMHANYNFHAIPELPLPNVDLSYTNLANLPPLPADLAPQINGLLPGHHDPARKSREKAENKTNGSTDSNSNNSSGNSRSDAENSAKKQKTEESSDQAAIHAVKLTAANDHPESSVKAE